MKLPRTFSEYATRLREFIRRSTAIAELDGPSAFENEFNGLARSLFALQFSHNAPYRQFCASRKVTPESIVHWSGIPAVPTAAFKELEMTCLPVERRTHFFHSSGTTTQTRGRHFHDAESLALYEASLLPWFYCHLLADRQPAAPGFDHRACFISLTPPPEAAPNSSLVHMFATVMREFGAKASAFTGCLDTGAAWQIDMERTLQIFHDLQREQLPVVIMGTAFNFLELADYMEARDERVVLKPGSRILETGGYKGRSRTLPKLELHELLNRALGVAERHIISEYGMCELSSQSYDHKPDESPENHSAQERVFRFPPWARIKIVSPETGGEASEGETGLIRVFDLANLSSVLAIQTEDLAIRRGDGFELIGRAAQAESRGCSLMSA
jgi:Acyl-protein synthetase, LuxE